MLETKPGKANIFELVVRSYRNSSPFGCLFLPPNLVMHHSIIGVQFRRVTTQGPSTLMKVTPIWNWMIFLKPWKLYSLSSSYSKWHNPVSMPKVQWDLHHSVKRLGLSLNIRDITRGLHPLWEIKAITYQLLGCWLNWLQKLHDHQNHFCLSLLM